MLHPGSTEIDLQRPQDEFAQNGFARLGNVLTAEAAEQLCERADALMLGEVRIQGLFYQHDSPTGRYEDLVFGAGWVGPSLEYRKLEKLELDPLFAAWIENPLFGRIAHAVLGKDISLYRAVLWNKAPHTGMALPWHQDDGAFWGLDRTPCLQIWTALDDAPVESGCVEVVPESHLSGLATPLGGTVPSDQLSRARAEERHVKLPVVAGDTLLIHNHLWHRSGTNTTSFPRRAIGISYLNAATRCKRRKRTPRVFQRLFQSTDDIASTLPYDDPDVVR